MRIFIRVMGITTIGMCVCLMLMHLLDLNIRKDEIDRISYLAMSNTQIVMQENIEDFYYQTNNARQKINSSAEYEQLYIDNIRMLQTTDGVYNLSFISDPLKGLLCVDIDYEYKNFLGQTKVINKKLINIINVEIDNET